MPLPTSSTSIIIYYFTGTASPIIATSQAQPHSVAEVSSPSGPIASFNRHSSSEASVGSSSDLNRPRSFSGSVQGPGVPQQQVHHDVPLNWRKRVVQQQALSVSTIYCVRTKHF